MLYFKAEMHQIRFPYPLTGFERSISKGREGNGEGEEKGRGRRGKKGRGKVASWLLGGWTPLYHR